MEAGLTDGVLRVKPTKVIEYVSAFDDLDQAQLNLDAMFDSDARVCCLVRVMNEQPRLRDVLHELWSLLSPTIKKMSESIFFGEVEGKHPSELRASVEFVRQFWQWLSWGGTADTFSIKPRTDSGMKEHTGLTKAFLMLDPRSEPSPNLNRLRSLIETLWKSAEMFAQRNGGNWTNEELSQHLKREQGGRNLPSLIPIQNGKCGVKKHSEAGQRENVAQDIIPSSRKRTRSIEEWSNLPLEEVKKLNRADMVCWAYAHDVLKEKEEKAFKEANPVRGPKKWVGVTLVILGYAWCVAVCLIMLVGCLGGNGHDDVAPFMSGNVVLLIPGAMLISWGYKLQGKEMPKSDP